VIGNAVGRRILRGRISHELYIDSRIPISALTEKIGISHQTVVKYVDELEKEYELIYTVDVDTSKLGFSEPRIITLKLEGMPDKEKLIQRFKSYRFVQNAYLAKGDFDIVMHVILPRNESYSGWEYTMRIELNRYNPRMKVATLNDFTEGFLPIREELIKMSNVLDKNEKKVLLLLVKNSRMKLKDLVKMSGLSQMKVIYSIKKMRKAGIIKRFTATIQTPGMGLFVFSGVSLIPTETHHSNFLKQLLLEIISNEHKDNLPTDYSVVCDTSGHFDSVNFLCFANGDLMYKRGPELIKRLWSEEHPKLDSCILTEVLIGKWPFNSNNYVNWEPMLKNRTNGKYDKIRTYHIL
jgi:DNA-binding Lrp family transcriptional regulator